MGLCLFHLCSGTVRKGVSILFNNLFTINKILVASIGAVGYGVGYKVSAVLGYDTLYCLTISLILGYLMDVSAKRLVYARIIHNHNLKKALIAAIIIFFISCDALVEKFLNVNLWEDLFSQFVYVLVVTLISFSIDIIISKFKAGEISKLYGDGTEGLKTDNKKLTAEINTLKGENKKISDSYSKENAVRFKNGIFVGEKKNNIFALRGIPYTEPITKEMRWQAPQPAKDSDEVFEALYFGASCLQIEDERHVLSYAKQSEDCLTLNIWKNSGYKDKKQKDNTVALRPVYVYLHGSDGTYSGSAMPVYHGGKFVKDNPEIIVVTINYRFGIMGFMDFSTVEGGEKYTDSTHLGILDVLTALKWINKNIAIIGGNPENVTLAGDTLGAMIALSLPVRPESKGLFKKILAITPIVGKYNTKQEAVSYTEQVKKHLNISTMKEFLNLSMEELRSASVGYYLQPMLCILDGNYLPKSIYEAYAQGVAKDIEIVMSYSKNDVNAVFIDKGNEFTLKWLRDSYDEMLKTLTAEQIHAVESSLVKFRRDGMDADEALVQLYTYYLLPAGQQLLCRNQTKAGGKAYYFVGNCGAAVDKLGAYFFSIIGLALGNNTAIEKYGLLVNKRTTKIFQRMLVNFMTDQGLKLNAWDIPDEKAIDWPLFTEEDPFIMEITDNGFIKHESDLLDDCKNIEILL